MIPSLHHFLGSLQELIQYDCVSHWGTQNWTLPGFGLIGSGNTDTTQDTVRLFAARARCWHMINLVSTRTLSCFPAAQLSVNTGGLGLFSPVQVLALPFYELQEVPVSLFFQQPIFPACWGLWIAAQTPYVVQQTIYSAQFCLISQSPSGGLPFYSVCEHLTLLDEGPVLLISVVRQNNTL